MRNAQVYRYEFEADGFEPWEQANGQWISEREVVPTSVDAGRRSARRPRRGRIELRI